MSAKTQPKYDSLKAWLQGTDPTKAASTLPEKDDGGKPATEGARSAENAKDVKTEVPGNSVEDATKNPADVQTSLVPDSGLQQTTVGKMPDVEKAVKVVDEESEKVAAANLSDDAQFDAAVESLNKMAAHLPQLFAAAGYQYTTPTAQPAVATQTVAPTATKQAEEARAELAGKYARYGVDCGTECAAALKGYYETYNWLRKAADDGQLAAMLAGGAPQGGGGGDPMGGGGAPPAAAPAPAGDPTGGAGAGGGGGGVTPDDLAAALAEMGATPDEVMMAAQKMQAMMGGGSAGPDDGAAPAGPPSGGDGGDSKPKDDAKEAAVLAEAKQAMATVIKMASEAKSVMRSGKFQLKPAADVNEAKRRTAAKDYIAELLRSAA